MCGQLRKMGMTREGAVRGQGGVTTQALSISRILTRPGLRFRKTGLVLRCPKGREASQDWTDKRPGSRENRPVSKPGSTTW